MRSRRITTRGFTLVELLVVISIISLLTSLSLASLTSARDRSHDTRRKEDLKQLQSALELYYTDHKSYPSTSGAWYGASVQGGSTSDWIPGLAKTYIAALPQDPRYAPDACGGWGGAYLYKSDGNNYKLLANCPINSAVADTPVNDAFYDPIRPTWAWALCSTSVSCENW